MLSQEDKFDEAGWIQGQLILAGLLGIALVCFALAESVAGMFMIGMLCLPVLPALLANLMEYADTEIH